MALSGNNDAKNCAFKSKDEKSFTAFQAVVISSEYLLNNQCIQTWKKFNGDTFEQIVNLALIVSSHSNSLMKTPFREWFPIFVQQLDCFSGGKFIQTPQNIELDDSFPMKDTCIPYFAFNHSEWHESLQKYLLENEIKLGTFESFKRDPVDLIANEVFMDLNENKLTEYYQSIPDLLQRDLNLRRRKKSTNLHHRSRNLQMKMY